MPTQRPSDHNTGHPADIAPPAMIAGRDELADLIRSDLMCELRGAIADLVDAEARFTSIQAAILLHDERRRSETEDRFAACNRLEAIYQRPHA